MHNIFISSMIKALLGNPEVFNGLIGFVQIVDEVKSAQLDVKSAMFIMCSMIFLMVFFQLVSIFLISKNYQCSHYLLSNVSFILEKWGHYYWSDKYYCNHYDKHGHGIKFIAINDSVMNCNSHSN